MSMRMWKMSLVLAAVLGGQFCLAAPTVWLDQVVLFDRPAGSAGSADATPALGPNDGVYVSIDIPETLIVAFTDNTASNGSGNDLKVWQVIAGDSNVDVYGSEDNHTYVFLGRIDMDTSFDLSGYPGLDFVNFVKFVGLDNGGGSAGFDLDAVEALNSVDHIFPADGAVPAPGAILLGAVGAGLIGSLRRRRAL